MRYFMNDIRTTFHRKMRDKKNYIPSMEDYIECTKDLIMHETIQKMKTFRHHDMVTCFHHSINVSKYSYFLCKLLGWDYRAAARGGLLHDLFLYDWRKDKLQGGKHGSMHPQIAHDNACELFELSDLEKDIILRHMFPLNTCPPSYKESMLVCFIDKLYMIIELFQSLFYRIKTHTSE